MKIKIGKVNEIDINNILLKSSIKFDKSNLLQSVAVRPQSAAERSGEAFMPGSPYAGSGL